MSQRLITNNVLVAFELLHSLKNCKRGTQGYAAIKLDMSKAFDRVEWPYLAQVILKMGFGSVVVNLILRSLQSVTYSFLLNGQVLGELVPTRGLQQGGPLSPYLFLICAEGLSRLLQTEEENGSLHGLKVSRSAPSMSHLFFADNSVLFCRANHQSARSIKHVLDIYGRASGQAVNSDKIWKFLSSWKEQLFSAGGKEVLLKAVVQAVPTYAMSCFRLPVTSSGLGATPSLTWRSIVWGKELLVQGLRWRVGTGAQINCKADSWLPRHTIFTPFCFTVSDTSLQVADLIDHHRQWDLTAIFANFGKADIDRILSIPLSIYPTDDILIWNGTTSGNYTVKSGYQFAVSMADS
ncbi:uncharacterized protein LOC133038406 [Cannabis sativa]|uniref:uncharacterized protein LOC133038406 n=1 Tax=Cannabis sativa TaxID=3483 RepID=UPI0029CA6F39|nr:uncharacterized protein LOC133038406 [Cannabis sativa]